MSRPTSRPADEDLAQELPRADPRRRSGAHRRLPEAESHAAPPATPVGRRRRAGTRRGSGLLDRSAQDPAAHRPRYRIHFDATRRPGVRSDRRPWQGLRRRLGPVRVRVPTAGGVPGSGGRDPGPPPMGADGLLPDAGRGVGHGEQSVERAQPRRSARPLRLPRSPDRQPS
jgi:hypothetical protein